MIRRSVLLAAVSGLLLGVSACDTGTDASAPPVASPAAVSTHAAQEAVSPDPNFDNGYTVQVTNGGFHPKWLVSTCCQAVSWKNLTNEIVVVTFDHQAFTSGPIPPGGTWQFTPVHPESISYHLGANTTISGVLQVQQNFES